MKKQTLEDALAVAISVGLPPSYTDEVAMAAWVGKLFAGLTKIGYDVWQNDPVAAGQMQAEAPPTPEEIEAAYYGLVNQGVFLAGAEVGKIGDGHILEWLKNLPWAQIIGIIIAVIPKAPA